VVLADDHQIVREGLGVLLDREADIQVVGQVEDGLSLVRLNRQLCPDVVVTDISMPGLNGFEAIVRILDGNPHAKVICLTVHGETRLVRAALDAGASGYLLKGCSFAELIQAVRGVVDKRIYLSPELVSGVIQDYRQGSMDTKDATLNQLSSREREILQLLAEGLATHHIAKRLHLSEKTVASHREHIMKKLQINNIAELTRYAIREGFCSVCTPCPKPNHFS